MKTFGNVAVIVALASGCASATPTNRPADWSSVANLRENTTTSVGSETPAEDPLTQLKILCLKEQIKDLGRGQSGVALKGPSDTCKRLEAGELGGSDPQNGGEQSSVIPQTATPGMDAPSAPGVMAPSAFPSTMGGREVIVATLYRPPARCGTGYMMPVRNTYFGTNMQLAVNGEPVVFRGGGGRPILLHGADGRTYSPLPPKQTGYLCLRRLGQHQLHGQIVAINMGQVQPVSGGSAEFNLSMVAGPGPNQTFVFDQADVILR